MSSLFTRSSRFAVGVVGPRALFWRKFDANFLMEGEFVGCRRLRPSSGAFIFDAALPRALRMKYVITAKLRGSLSSDTTSVGHSMIGVCNGLHYLVFNHR